jgi:hypothetical protein
MHIIFGKEKALELSDKYTVLELDTFRFDNLGSTVTAYCAVEKIPIEELSLLESIKSQHQDLIINYRLRNWEACLGGIKELKGKLRGELDTFYQDLEKRIQAHIISPPPADWSPVIAK